MNDFGVFSVLQQALTRDEYLSEKITMVVTEKRPGLGFPFIQAKFLDLCLDIPCLVQSALLKCEIHIFSDYHGDMEIHEIMSRLNFVLDGVSWSVHVDAMNKAGKAMFKLQGQQMHMTGGIREGVLSYQVKVSV